MRERRYAPTLTAAELRGGDAVARVRNGIARKEATHDELVAILKGLLREAGEEVFTRWSTLRRMLALAGHRTTRTHLIAMALFDAVPGARLGRGGYRHCGPRGVYGVALVCDLEAMREAVEKRWESKVGIPPEVQLTSMEYKLSPGEGTHGGRLAELVTRVHIRRAEASIYYGIALDYLNSNVWGHGHSVLGAKAVWALHCEGATRLEIARELDMDENKVQSTIDYHRARCGLVHR